MQSRLHGNALSNMEELMSRMLVPQSTQEVRVGSGVRVGRGVLLCVGKF